jgi:hypothetical protein
LNIDDVTDQPNHLQDRLTTSYTNHS